MTSFGDMGNITKIAGILYPKGYFGEIWKASEVDEIWPWELTFLEPNKNTRLATTYPEALQSLQNVVSL